MADISKIKPNGASGTEYDLKDATARAAMIPSGGTQGQVLVKKTQADYDTEWSNGGGGTTVVANPSGTATDDLTKVQIGSDIYEIYDKGAMRGVSIKVSSSTTAERYYLIWEHTGAPQGYISPLQISGDIGGWTGGSKIDISCIFNRYGGNNIPRMYGFKESDTAANIIITRTSTGSSDNNTHDRLYIYFPTGLYYAEANLNIIPPESAMGQGTFYTNPTATTTYEGTFATSLAACPVTNKLVGLSDVNISNLQDGQILQYDATSQKWVNHVNDPEYIAKTVTIFSAALDTLTFTDATGQKTVTTDANGEGTSVIVYVKNQNITFTSSVAKNPSDLSQAYSKSVTIGENTTSIYVMPDNVLYWYGYKNCNITPSTYRFNGALSQFIAPTVTENTNRLTLTASSAYGTVWFLPVITKSNLKVNTIVNINMGSQNMLQMASQYTDQYSENGNRFRPSTSSSDQYGYSEATSGQDHYIVFLCETNTHYDIKALWHD